MLKSIVRLLAALVWLALLGRSAGALAIEAAVLLSKRSDVQTAFVEALTTAVAPVGSVRLTDAGSAGDESVDEAALKRADLVIAVGAEAADLVAARGTAPVLATLISTQNLRVLQTRYPRAKLGGLVLDQPFGRHMRLIRATLPKATRIGVLLGPQSASLRATLAEAAAHQGLNMVSEKIDDGDELLPALERLLEASDVILAVPDPVAYSPSTARPILLTTYRYRKPLFGYSQAYVTAGAIAAVYTAPNDAARQVAEWLQTQAGSGHVELPAVQAPRYFSVGVNRHVARSLLYPVPDEPALVEAIDKRRAQ